MNGYNVNVTGHSHPRSSVVETCGACLLDIAPRERHQQLRLTVDCTRVTVRFCAQCVPMPEGDA